jgi:SpoVK/Ycf46/Vps4 family AAA+-type ATPase
VLGATNRPNDIDAAILRRMPKRFAIKLPDAQQRKSILTLVRSLRFSCHKKRSLKQVGLCSQMLKDIKVNKSFSIDTLVKKTAGLSGSDLKETCRNAAMVPVRDYMRAHQVNGQLDLTQVKAGTFEIRPLSLNDFLLNESTLGGRIPEVELD